MRDLIFTIGLLLMGGLAIAADEIDENNSLKNNKMSNQ